MVTQVRCGEVSTPTTSMDERESLLRALPAAAAGGRGNDGGEGGCLGAC